MTTEDLIQKLATHSGDERVGLLLNIDVNGVIHTAMMEIGEIHRASTPAGRPFVALVGAVDVSIVSTEISVSLEWDRL